MKNYYQMILNHLSLFIKKCINVDSSNTSGIKIVTNLGAFNELAIVWREKIMDI